MTYVYELSYYNKEIIKYKISYVALTTEGWSRVGEWISRVRYLGRGNDRMVEERVKVDEGCDGGS